MPGVIPNSGRMNSSPPPKGAHRTAKGEHGAFIASHAVLQSHTGTETSCPVAGGRADATGGNTGPWSAARSPRCGTPFPGQGQPQQVGQRGVGSGLAAINICSPVSLALLAAGTSREAALLCTSPQLRECRAASVDFEFVVVAEDQRSVIEGDRPATRKCPVTPERTVVGNDVAVIFDDDPRRAQPWIAHQPRAPRSAGADPHAYRNPSCLLSVAARSRHAVHLPRRLLCSRAPRPGSVTRRWVFRAASRGGAGGECGRCGSARPLGRVSPQTFSNDFQLLVVSVTVGGADIACTAASCAF